MIQLYHKKQFRKANTCLTVMTQNCKSWYILDQLKKSLPRSLFLIPYLHKSLVSKPCKKITFMFSSIILLEDPCLFYKHANNCLIKKFLLFKFHKEFINASTAHPIIYFVYKSKKTFRCSIFNMCVFLRQHMII